MHRDGYVNSVVRAAWNFMLTAQSKTKQTNKQTTQTNKQNKKTNPPKKCLRKMLMEYKAGLCLGSRIDRFQRMVNHYACFKKMPSLPRDSVTFRKLKKKKMCLISNPSIWSVPNEYLYANRTLRPEKGNGSNV